MLLVSPSPQLREGVKALKTMTPEEINFAIETATYLETNEKLALKKTFKINNEDNKTLGNWN